MDKPFISVADAVNDLWTATDPMYFWHKASITYSMPPTGWADSGVDYADNNAAHARIAMAFHAWDELIGIDIKESANNPDANIMVTYTHQLTGLYANTSTPADGTTLLDATIQISSDVASAPSETGYSSVAYSGIFLHEIGHALGLDHPDNYDATNSVYPTYKDDATFAQDSVQFTVMSYFGGWIKGADGTWNFDIHGEDHPEALYPQTPMLYDIAAVQKVYGHDYDTRHTDTTYGFHSNTGGDLYDFSKNTLPILTIWDGGGNDTLDVSGFTQNQVIDLRSGYFSDIGPLHDNITIAFDCDIENATGGTGNDVMIGNSLTNVLKGGAGNDSIKGAAGNDFLYGETGQDKLDGGPGQDYLGGGLDNDTFVFTALSDSTVSAPDIIIDFRAGDRIDVSNIDANARVAGNQAFSFVKDFTGHAGELQWDSNGSDIFTITADVNGDKIPDFAVQVYHLGSMTQLTAADFIL